MSTTVDKTPFSGALETLRYPLPLLSPAVADEADGTDAEEHDAGGFEYGGGVTMPSPSVILATTKPFL